LFKKTGSLKPGKAKGWVSKVDKSAVLKVLAAEPDLYLRELGDRFGLTESAMSKYLKRHEITRKKNALLLRKRREKKA